MATAELCLHLLRYHNKHSRLNSQGNNQRDSPLIKTSKFHIFLSPNLLQSFRGHSAILFERHYCFHGRDTSSDISPIGNSITIEFGRLIHEVSRSHTTTHHSRQNSSGQVINWSQRQIPVNTKHSQQTNCNAPGGNRTHGLSRRAAADLRHHKIYEALSDAEYDVKLLMLGN